MATEVKSTYRGVDGVLYNKVDHFALEALRLHGPNIVSFHLTLGGHRWYVVGAIWTQTTPQP